MRPAFDKRQRTVADGIHRTLTADFERNDAIGIAVNDQRRDIELRQIVAEVGAPEGRDAIQRALGRGEPGDIAVILAVGVADEQPTLFGGKEVAGKCP